MAEHDGILATTTEASTVRKTSSDGATSYPKDAREWFTNLTMGNRAVALGFVDKGFLTELSRAASLSTRTSAGGRPTSDRRASTESIDWMVQISSETFDVVIHDPVQVEESKVADQVVDIYYDKTPVDAQEGTSKEVETPNGMERPKAEVAEDVPATEVEEPLEKSVSRNESTYSDEFRIREFCSSEQSNEVTLVSPDTSPKTTGITGNEKMLAALVEPQDKSHFETQNAQSDEAASTGNADQKNIDPEKVRTFVESVCTIFPAAFRLVKPDAAASGDSQPLITLQPSFLSTVSGQELLLTLDEIMPSGKFLFGPTCNSWKETIQCLSEKQTPISIPLYMLLLLRFQNSVYDSYSASLLKTPAASDLPSGERIMTKTRSRPLSQAEDEANRVDSDIKREEAAPTVNEASDAASDESHDLVGQQEVNEVDCDSAFSLLPSLFEHSLSLSTSSLDWNQVLRTLVATLDEVLALSDSKDLDSSLNALDADVSKTIRSFLAIAKEPNTKQLAMSGSIDNLSESPKVEAQTVTQLRPEGIETPEIVDQVELTVVAIDKLPSTPGTPNRKKKKKKKRRKGSSGAASADIDNHEQTETSEQNEDDILNFADKVEISTQTDFIENEIDVDVSGTTAALPLSSDTDRSVDESIEISKTESKDEGTDEVVTKTDSTDTNDSLHISKLDGLGTTVFTPSLTEEQKALNSKGPAHSDSGNSSVAAREEYDAEEWETVEVRPRGSRKKGNGRNQHNHSSHNNGSKKKAPRNAESRKRNQKRKMVRDILSSVLDAVDEQVRRRRVAAREPSPRPTANAWTGAQTASSGRTGSKSADTQNSSLQRKDVASMRDILVGKQGAGAAKAENKQQQQRAFAERVRQRGVTGDIGKKNRERVPIGSPNADQNTAPTLPETLSAVSTASAFTETPSVKNLPKKLGGTPSESSSDGSVEATKQHSNATQGGKEVSPSPPLPTLLSPGIANSASSSVASSLDAPHAVHHSHHSSYPGNENDVGYHLLHVCDRLTRDIAQFMKRREHALNVRRMERGLVLGALQETLTTIWPGLGAVEMYGSCATDLDLPSSDLDVVVRGLDIAEPHTPQKLEHEDPVVTTETEKDDTEVLSRVSNPGVGSTNDIRHMALEKSPLPSAHEQQYPMYGHISPNAERVVRLAMELEQQPWAVHVKAIPTATVPVIKILADPARLPGVIDDNGEWLVQEPYASQSPTAVGQGTNDPADPMTMYPGAHSQLPWRGADIVNGLLSVDITFEGPEHGGIGSTKFSSRVVDECSGETGLPQDGTPFVQVLMVLKELLAQRRLNEPFSGGLSSYALLLLVVSVVRERSIIRKELERVERQRRMVAAGGGNAVPRSSLSETAFLASKNAHATIKKPNSSTQTKEKGPSQIVDGKTVKASSDGKVSGKRSESRGQQLNGGMRPSNDTKANDTLQQKPLSQKPSKTSGNDKARTPKRGTPASSSWATIAKKSSAPLLQNSNQESTQNTAASAKSPTIKKMTSFADAVAKGTPAPVTSSIKPDHDGASRARSKSTDATAKAASVRASIEKKTRETDRAILANSHAKAAVAATSSGTEVQQGQSNADSSLHTKQYMASGLSDEPASYFPQSFHDVIEVLCSGETTPGKLLMHFLLFYGQHFDSHSTAIDYSDTHDRDANANNGYSTGSPYLQRRNTGSYDPMTGMLTIDPIVVYDPLEGAEMNNVARSCFAWSSIRWVFAQSYMTLSSAVEMSAGHTSEKGNGRNSSSAPTRGTGSAEPQVCEKEHDAARGLSFSHDELGNVIFDPSSPLLELLLAF